MKKGNSRFIAGIVTGVALAIFLQRDRLLLLLQGLM